MAAFGPTMEVKFFTLYARFFLVSKELSLFRLAVKFTVGLCSSVGKLKVELRFYLG